MESVLTKCILCVSLSLSLSLDHHQSNTIYYESHRYEFNHNDLIHRANDESLVEDEHILISVINSSVLSYEIDNILPLGFSDDTSFHQISYKYKALLTAPQKRRRTLNDYYYYDDDDRYYSIDEAAAYLNDYITMDDDEAFAYYDYMMDYFEQSFLNEQLSDFSDAERAEFMQQWDTLSLDEQEYLMEAMDWGLKNMWKKTKEGVSNAWDKTKDFAGTHAVCTLYTYGTLK